MRNKLVIKAFEKLIGIISILTIKHVREFDTLLYISRSYLCMYDMFMRMTYEDNKSCGLRMTYDLQRGKSLGTLTVRVCWCTIIFRDEIGFAAEHFVY